MDLEYLQQQIAQNEAVLVYFSGQNCGVCEALMPKIKEVFTHEFPKVKQHFISANEFPQIAAHFNVFTVPTLLVFLDGKEFMKKSRNFSLPQLASQLQRPYSLYFS